MATIIDTAKLTAQATELRAKMVQALGEANDSQVRKLGNELATVNKQLLDARSESESGARDTFRLDMIEALEGAGFPGLALTIRYSLNDEGQENLNIVFTPTKKIIAEIKECIGLVSRPSTANRWTYTQDEAGLYDVEVLGRKAPTAKPANGSGTPNRGWVGPDGIKVTLSEAFTSVATEAEKATLDGKTNTQQWSIKNKVVKAGGFSQA